MFYHPLLKAWQKYSIWLYMLTHILLLVEIIAENEGNAPL